MADRIECAVIGAGVVGLACARRLALDGREVVVLERAETIGTETSSRNSEVIHAGIYYPKGSLKARFCVAGKHAMYAYCDEHGIPYQRCGKLIVATEEKELADLDRIKAFAAENGVPDLVRLDAKEVKELEPEVFCIAALLSPSTGIVDSHQLMLGYQGDAEAHGAAFAFCAPVVGGRVENDGIRLQVGGVEATALKAEIVVNAAGLGAQPLSRSIKGIPPGSIPPLYYAKGNYYTLAGRSPFKRLIYPTPGQASLGVHELVDMGGQVRFGPDVEWIDEIDYDVDPARADVFYAAVRRYYPGLRDGALQPGYAGIRPKLQAPGTPAKDFMIQGPAEHGVPGLINLYGIESPGLTSALAIADHVAGLINGTA
jgi:L-2-hydroxyglutarate oxidase LhgO